MHLGNNTSGDKGIQPLANMVSPPLVVYGMRQATCTQRVLTTLAELQEPFELKEVDLRKGDNQKAEYLKLQPFGKIPAVEDPDLGLSLFESRAIIRYLAEKYHSKAPHLLGADAKAKALVSNWLEAESQNFNPPAQSIVFERVFKKMRGGQPDEAKVTEYKEQLVKVLDVLDKVLADRPYLAGEHYSIADIAATPYLAMLEPAGEWQLITDRPNVAAWADRLVKRPSFTKSKGNF
jgi:glutathione S-transferase